MDAPQSTNPASFEWLQGLPVLRLGPETEFQAAVQQVTLAIRQAVSCGYPDLIVCVREVRFAPPSLAARHSMVRAFAEASAGRVRVAMLVRPELIDPERFGVVAAANFGLQAWVCSDEVDALDWLAHGAAD